VASVTAPASLDEVRDRGDESYPVRLLEHCDTALILFAAAFYGRQDAVFVADAGVTGTCVDVAPMHEMARIYPPDWTFVTADAYRFAEDTGGQWDLVSVDCPTGAFRECAERLPLWCDLARRAVVLGTGSELEVRPPPGWTLTDVRRRSDFKGGVYWAVVERAE
jgi:hypothetical protein